MPKMYATEDRSIPSSLTPADIALAHPLAFRKKSKLPLPSVHIRLHEKVVSIYYVGMNTFIFQFLVLINKEQKVLKNKLF